MFLSGIKCRLCVARLLHPLLFTKSWSEFRLREGRKSNDVVITKDETLTLTLKIVSPRGPNARITIMLRLRKARTNFLGHAEWGSRKQQAVDFVFDTMETELTGFYA